MSKKNVLFVDDEPNILDGLRRMLRSLRKEFVFDFASGGSQALEVMAEKEIDIIVTDMRMPGMDGAELLTEVQKNYPHAIRIMLTGQADEESIMHTIEVAHQFLAKPCDPDRLKDILYRSGALHSMLTNQGLRIVVANIGSLPSLPSLYSQLQEKLNDPDVVLDDLANIISQDIGMSAKILQLVNSAFFGLYQKVETPARAVSLLGIDTIKALVLGLQIFREFSSEESVLPAEHLWQHSMCVANMARQIALSEECDKETVEMCYLSGILHDVGKLMLLGMEKGGYGEIIEYAQQQEIALSAAESEKLQATHGSIGAYLLGIWGFSSEVVEATGFHNQLNEYPADKFSVTLAVHAADAIFYEVFPESVRGKPEELDLSYLERIDLQDRVSIWREKCQESLEKIDT